MWCWKRMEKISWTKHVKNEDLFYTVKDEKEHPTYKKMKKG